MAMDYPDDLASVGHCSQRLGNYDGTKYCDYDNHLPVCGAQHYNFITMVACSCLLLYDRLLYRCYIGQNRLPVGYQEELYLFDGRNLQHACLGHLCRRLGDAPITRSHGQGPLFPWHCYAWCNYVVITLGQMDL